jgi:hypothetical protein
MTVLYPLDHACRLSLRASPPPRGEGMGVGGPASYPPTPSLPLRGGREALEPSAVYQPDPVVMGAGA